MNSCTASPAAAVAAVLIAIASLAPSTGQAQRHSQTVVIRGTLSAGLFVSMQASGPSGGTLTGQGFDVPPNGSGVSGAPGNPGTCEYTQNGSVSGTTVTLSGNVFASSNPSFIGVPVTTTADASTGSITWNFGGFVFTGTGSVVIK